MEYVGQMSEGWQAKWGLEHHELPVEILVPVQNEKKDLLVVETWGGKIKRGMSSSDR